MPLSYTNISTIYRSELMTHEWLILCPHWSLDGIMMAYAQRLQLWQRQTLSQKLKTLENLYKLNNNWLNYKHQHVSPITMFFFLFCFLSFFWLFDIKRHSFILSPLDKTSMHNLALQVFSSALLLWGFHASLQRCAKAKFLIFGDEGMMQTNPFSET